MNGKSFFNRSILTPKYEKKNSKSFFVIFRFTSDLCPTNCGANIDNYIETKTKEAYFFRQSHQN